MRNVNNKTESLLSDCDEEGALPGLPQKQSRLAVYEGFNLKNVAKAMEALSAGTIDIAVFPQATPPEALAQAVKRINDDERMEGYVGAPNVLRNATSLYEIHLSESAAIKYWANADRDREAARQLFAPFASPLAEFQLMADALPGFNGANILRIANKPAFLGLVRRLGKSAGILAHNDDAPSDMSDSPETQQIDVQLALNVYVETPDYGGELTVWDRRLGRLEYDAGRREDEPYALRDDVLPQTRTTHLPQPGDFVIFNASKPHAVSPSEGGFRHSVSGFAGVTRNREILLFS